jgi:hypothetical protein
LLLVQATEAMLTYRNALLGTFPDGVVRRDGLVEVVGSIPALLQPLARRKKAARAALARTRLLFRRLLMSAPYLLRAEERCLGVTPTTSNPS